MKKILTIFICAFALLVPTLTLAGFGTYNNYGFWYDRDGVDPYQDAYASTPAPGGSSVPWGVVDGGTYNTGGIYNVVITYHALSATSATMFATINGVQQGFYTAGYKNAQPDIYPAGLSFTNSDMTHMEVFDSIWGSARVNGTAVFQNITATGTRLSGAFKSTNYGNVTYSGSPNYPGDGSGNVYASQFTLGTWDLTRGDLTLSFTANLSAVTRPSDVFAIGLQPYGLDLRTPTGGGWMAMTVASSAPSPGNLGLNDKFDLQNGWTDETGYDVRPVPIPAAVWLFGSGLIGLIGIRRKLKK